LQIYYDTNDADEGRFCTDERRSYLQTLFVVWPITSLTPERLVLFTINYQIPDVIYRFDHSERLCSFFTSGTWTTRVAPLEKNLVCLLQYETSRKHV
jgi:hypothetical protein